MLAAAALAVARNDGGIDGANRDARHPTRLDPGFVDGLIRNELRPPLSSCFTQRVAEIG